MKSIFTSLLTFSAVFVFGQDLVQSRTATLEDGAYSLSGTVHLELYDDNSLNLRFDSDYLTQRNVFDVHVFLTNNNDYKAPIDTAGMLLVENIGTVSGLNYSSGAMTFSLPEGVGIDDYKHIVFICMRFGQLHWGDGTFEESGTTNTSDISNAAELQANIFPNPSNRNHVEISFEKPLQKGALVEVINVDGGLVYSEYLAQGTQSYVLGMQRRGTYFLRITSEKASFVKKVILL